MHMFSIKQTSERKLAFFIASWLGYFLLPCR